MTTESWRPRPIALDEVALEERLIVKSRVRRGAEFLDDHYEELTGDPLPWHQNISLDRLIVSNECYCVVGQVFDGQSFYEVDVKIERAFGLSTSDLGLDISSDRTCDPHSYWELLQHFWEKEIEARS